MTNARLTGVENMLIETDKGLAALLTRVRHIALVGASQKPERPSYQVMQFLLAEGYRVTPVNPMLAGQRLQGQLVMGGLADIDAAVDMVDVFREGRALPGIVEEAVSLGVSALWTQLEVRHSEAEVNALAQGLDLVVDKCPQQELPRLRALGLM